MDNFYKSSCRISQNEDSHILKWNGSVYAYDIACGGKTEIFAPDFFDRYYIKNISKDNRLWNYIILRNWEYEIVISHIAVNDNINIWDRVNKKAKLWFTDLSGISTGYHIHTELWLRWKNIKFEKLRGGNLEVNEKYSLSLKEQRWWLSSIEINQTILDFIAWFEGFSLTAYWDFSKWSIWYWTSSYEWEIITQEEANKRARKHIQYIREKYDLFDLSLDKQKAVTSFIYNVWGLSNKQLWLIKNNYWRALWNNFKLYNKATIINEKWKKVKKVLNWLVDRRNAEYNLLIK